jgi:hypothetical protein
MIPKTYTLETFLAVQRFKLVQMWHIHFQFEALLVAPVLF